MGQRDTLGMGKDPTAMAKRRGEGRKTKEAESRGWEDATDMQWLILGGNHHQLTLHLLNFSLGSAM